MKYWKGKSFYEGCSLDFRFNGDPSLEKKMLPQYDDPAAEEVCYSCYIPKKDDEQLDFVNACTH